MKKEIQTRLLVLLIGISGVASGIHIAAANTENAKTMCRNHIIPNPKLQTLEVVKNGGTIQVFWSANNEANDNYYTLERSKNGINFEQVARIDAANTLNTAIQYVETDYQPLKGISYYRLKCTGFKKNISYSNIAMVNDAGDHTGIKRSGNKTIDALKQLPLSDALVILRDHNGKKFYAKVVVAVEDQDIIGYDIEIKLTPGTYLITGTSSNMLYGQKLIVRHPLTNEFQKYIE